MTTTTIPRTGPRMRDVVRYVAAHPGCPKTGPAGHVAPHGTGRGYGYRTVDRAVAAGLIAAEVTPRGYALTVTAAGERVLP